MLFRRCEHFCKHFRRHIFVGVIAAAFGLFVLSLSRYNAVDDAGYSVISERNTQVRQGQVTKFAPSERALAGADVGNNLQLGSANSGHPHVIMSETDKGANNSASFPWARRQRQLNPAEFDLGSITDTSDSFTFTPFEDRKTLDVRISKLTKSTGNTDFVGAIVDENGKRIGEAIITQTNQPQAAEDGSSETRGFYSARLGLDDGTLYLVKHDSEGNLIVEEVDQEKYPSCQGSVKPAIGQHSHGESVPNGGQIHMKSSVSHGAVQVQHKADAMAGADESPINPIASADNTTVTVMVLYTPQAETAMGGQAATETLIQNAILAANTAYTNSQVNITLQLVHTEKVTGYTETDFTTDLTRLSGTSDGHMDNVHTLRNTYGADVVSLFVNNAAYCGLGYQLEALNPGYSFFAFTLVNHGCAVGYFSFAHELGHNMGADHDHDNSGGQLYPAYSYGHRFGSWRTIMAYAPGTRLGYFSNPSVSHSGLPTGIAEGSPNAADNARTLNQSAYLIADYREDVISTTTTSVATTTLPTTTTSVATTTLPTTTTSVATTTLPTTTTSIATTTLPPTTTSVATTTPPTTSVVTTSLAPTTSVASTVPATSTVPINTTTIATSTAVTTTTSEPVATTAPTSTTTPPDTTTSVIPTLSTTSAPSTTPVVKDSDSDGLPDSLEETLGTDPDIADSDGDGVSDSVELTDGSDLLDKGSYRERFAGSVCSSWNGYLSGYWNIVEHVNLSSQKIKLESVLYSANSKPQGKFVANLAKNAQADLLVHLVRGFSENSYGSICTKVVSTKGLIDGRTVYYKTDPQGAFQFAYSVPFSAGVLGAQHVTYDTQGYRGSVGLESPESKEQAVGVLNWLELTNISNRKQKGKLRVFNRGGSLIATRDVTLPARGRQDYSLHNFKSTAGLVEWQPSNRKVPFEMRMTRYVYTSDEGSSEPTLETAYALSGRGGSGQKQTLVVDLTRPNNSGTTLLDLEIANVLAEPTAVNITLFRSDGKQLAKVKKALSAKQSASIALSTQLSGASGMVVIEGAARESVIASGVVTSFAADGTIENVGQSPAREALGDRLTGSYNSFLDQSCHLAVANPSNKKAKFTARLVNTVGKSTKLATVSIPSHRTMNFDVCSKVKKNTYGTVIVEPTQKNLLVAELVRSTTHRQYRLSTPVR